MTHQVQRAGTVKQRVLKTQEESIATEVLHPGIPDDFPDRLANFCEVLQSLPSGYLSEQIGAAGGECRAAIDLFSEFGAFAFLRILLKFRKSGVSYSYTQVTVVVLYFWSLL
jgi:hypothetical protein